MNAARKIVARQPVLTVEDAARSAWHFLCRRCAEVPGSEIVIAELETALHIGRVGDLDAEATVDLAALVRAGLDDGPDLPF